MIWRTIYLIIYLIVLGCCFLWTDEPIFAAIFIALTLGFGYLVEREERKEEDSAKDSIQSQSR